LENSQNGGMTGFVGRVHINQRYACTTFEYARNVFKGATLVLPPRWVAANLRVRARQLVIAVEQIRGVSRRHGRLPTHDRQPAFDT
jgi:hypothetical protein